MLKNIKHKNSLKRCKGEVGEDLEEVMFENQNRKKNK
jgi:hypothetical protein